MLGSNLVKIPAVIDLTRKIKTGEELARCKSFEVKMRTVVFCWIWG